MRSLTLVFLLSLLCGIGLAEHQLLEGAWYEVDIPKDGLTPFSFSLTITPEEIFAGVKGSEISFDFGGLSSLSSKLQLSLGLLPTQLMNVQNFTSSGSFKYMNIPCTQNGCTVYGELVATCSSCVSSFTTEVVFRYLDVNEAYVYNTNKQPYLRLYRDQWSPPFTPSKTAWQYFSYTTATGSQADNILVSLDLGTLTSVTLVASSISSKPNKTNLEWVQTSKSDTQPFVENKVYTLGVLANDKSFSDTGSYQICLGSCSNMPWDSESNSASSVLIALAAGLLALFAHFFQEGFAPGDSWNFPADSSHFFSRPL